jgi:hypothetical protein
MKIIGDYTKHISIQPKPSVLINKLNGLIDVSMSTAAKIGLVLMDDDTDNDGDLKSSAFEAWSKGLNLLSIGVGRRTDQLEMSSIAKSQTDYYMQLQDWGRLNTDGFSWAIRTFENCQYFIFFYLFVLSTPYMYLYLFKGIGSILFFKNCWRKFCRKIYKNHLRRNNYVV